MLLISIACRSALALLGLLAHLQVHDRIRPMLDDTWLIEGIIPALTVVLDRVVQSSFSVLPSPTSWPLLETAKIASSCTDVVVIAPNSLAAYPTPSTSLSLDATTTATASAPDLAPRHTSLPTFSDTPANSNVAVVYRAVQIPDHLTTPLLPPIDLIPVVWFVAVTALVVTGIGLFIVKSSSIKFVPMRQERFEFGQYGLDNSNASAYVRQIYTWNAEDPDNGQSSDFFYIVLAGYNSRPMEYSAQDSLEDSDSDEVFVYPGAHIEPEDPLHEDLEVTPDTQVISTAKRPAFTIPSTSKSPVGLGSDTHDASDEYSPSQDAESSGSIKIVISRSPSSDTSSQDSPSLADTSIEEIYSPNTIIQLQNTSLGSSSSAVYDGAFIDTLGINIPSLDDSPMMESGTSLTGLGEPFTLLPYDGNFTLCSEQPSIADVDTRTVPTQPPTPLLRSRRLSTDKSRGKRCASADPAFSPGISRERSTMLSDCLFTTEPEPLINCERNDVSGRSLDDDSDTSPVVDTPAPTPSKGFDFAFRPDMVNLEAPPVAPRPPHWPSESSLPSHRIQPQNNNTFTHRPAPYQRPMPPPQPAWPRSAAPAMNPTRAPAAPLPPPGSLPYTIGPFEFPVTMPVLLPPGASIATHIPPCLPRPHPPPQHLPRPFGQPVPPLDLPTRPSGAPMHAPPPRPFGAPMQAPPPRPLGTPMHAPPSHPSGPPMHAPHPRPFGAPMQAPPPRPLGTPMHAMHAPPSHPSGAPMHVPPRPFGAPMQAPPPRPLGTPWHAPPSHPSGAPVHAPHPRPFGAPMHTPPSHPSGTPMHTPSPRPAGLSTSIHASVDNPSGLSTSMHVPPSMHASSVYSDLSTSMHAPSSRPSELSTSMHAPSAHPSGLSTSMHAPSGLFTSMHAPSVRFPDSSASMHAPPAQKDGLFASLHAPSVQSPNVSASMHAPQSQSSGLFGSVHAPSDLFPGSSFVQSAPQRLSGLHGHDPNRGPPPVQSTLPAQVASMPSPGFMFSSAPFASLAQHAGTSRPTSVSSLGSSEHVSPIQSKLSPLAAPFQSQRPTMAPRVISDNEPLASSQGSAPSGHCPTPVHESIPLGANALSSMGQATESAPSAAAGGNFNPERAQSMLSGHEIWGTGSRTLNEGATPAHDPYADILEGYGGSGAMMPPVRSLARQQSL